MASEILSKNIHIEFSLTTFGGVKANSNFQ